MYSHYAIIGSGGASRYLQFLHDVILKEMKERDAFDQKALSEALQRQSDPEEHDRSLIVERLAWTPEERLDANSAFLRFYLSVRPEGPLIEE